MLLVNISSSCKSTFPVNVTKAYNSQLQNVICNFQTIYKMYTTTINTV